MLNLTGSYAQFQRNARTISNGIHALFCRNIHLSWSGTGVSFLVSTDSGKTWESVANGKATVLQNPGNRLVLKAMLQMAATTALDI
jgi:hypothetical protein